MTSSGAPGLDFETWENGGAVGFVLAGGKSTRMGTDKALLGFDGRTLVAQAIDTIRAAGVPVFIAGARSPLDSYAAVIPDSEHELGPLAGICTALASTSARRALFLPVDLPLLPSSLLVYLLHHARITDRAVTLTSVNAFTQTFPVVLARDTLGVLDKELRSRRCGCFAAFQGAARARSEPVSILPVEVLVQSGKVAHPDVLPAVEWFLNVNTPADLRRASTRIRLG